MGVKHFKRIIYKQMNIRNLAIAASITAAVVASGGCAKSEKSGKFDDDKAWVEAWLSKYHPEAQKVERGIYVLDSDMSGVTSDKDSIGKDGYAFVEYTVTNLEGTISQYTGSETAKQLGTYSASSYYGPKVICTVAKSSYAGVIDGLVGMKIGEKKTFLVPNWLMSYKDYPTEDKYLKESSSYSHSIYSVKAVRFVEDITEWQNGLIKSFINDYIAENGIPKESVDSLAEGLYLITLKEPDDTTAFPTDSTYYINYTGRLLDGTVFDTTVERTAKINGIYNSSKAYGAATVKNAETASSITLGGSTTISGFYTILSNMRSMQTAIGVFNSNYGYGYSGSGSSIPGYAPLTFEVEMTTKPE